MTDNAAQIAALEANIANLKAAIYSGALRVRFNDRDTTFRSMPELKDALRMAEAELATLQPPAIVPRRTKQTRFLPRSSV